MYDMTIFTIIYNGYGKFLPKWLECIRKQNKRPGQILVVLGKDHGVTDFPEDVKFIKSISNNMGKLRNKAIEEKKYDKCLYFSVDDELLPNAVQEIERKFNQGYKVVGLKFNDLQTVGTRETVRGEITPIRYGTVRQSYIVETSWRGTNVPGWVAVDGSYKYEEIGIPNYPYLFMLKSLELPMAHTDNVVANYIRRDGSHGDIANKENKFDDYAKEIDYWMEKLLKPQVLRGGF